MGASLVIAAGFAATSASAAVIDTFDNALTLGPIQAPGVWYTDRYAPNGFTGGVSFAGRTTLEHKISAADNSVNRPSSFSSPFYNTQGRKFDLPANTNSMSIELYVPASYASSGQRNAGFWGTAVNNANAISAFPIVEFTSGVDVDGSGPRFRGFNVLGGWINMGLPTGFTYDSWQAIDISLVGTNVVYTVGDLTLSQASGGSTSFSNTILQGHTIGLGSTYDIHWDNLNAIPTPGAIALLGMSGLLVARRRR